MREKLHGVLVVDKPRGPTSHDVVARARRALGVREIGHAGTLDPMATGVLVLAIGEGCKLVPYLTADAKAYEATIALGVETDTLDAEGTETARVPVATIAPERLLAALEAERARTEQVPPAVSAIKQGGERAYARARRGEEVVLAPRPVEVLELSLRAATPGSMDVSLVVSKGYYVRALARDLARALGTVGHLTSLRRVRSGTFTIDEAAPLDLAREELAARVIPLADAAARALPVARLTEKGAEDARHGRRVRPEDLSASSRAPHAWVDPEGRVVAIGQTAEDGSGQVLRGFISQ